MSARSAPVPQPLPEGEEFLAPLFLGAAGENGELFERLLLGLVRDHVHWRRNFHPEDPPSISAAVQRSPAFGIAAADIEQALRELSARLKRSAPLFSPRYIGHMASDLLLPGLLAQLVTTLYNPNNVSAEVAPVTIDLELAVGRQLATMLGFNLDPARGSVAYGHLTSGGTLANYEALWLQRALRFYPLALADAVADDPELARLPQLAGRDAWQLANLSIDEVIALQESAEVAIARRSDAAVLRRRIADARFERLGTADFLARHRLAAPVVIAPRTAHYSWPKAMQLLGLGDAQLWYADVDAHMRLDPASVERVLARAWRERVPVLALIAVLGTTEFGTIDPVRELVALRRRAATRGQGFGLHVDAAWGGYLATMFRAADGRALPRARLRREFRHFPSTAVYGAFTALGAADSVTVDPHKLGFLPFGAGAFVGRDRRMIDFVGQHPVYIYDEVSPHATGERLAQLGDYILEGSKAGAAAAAAYVTHRVLPLDAAHFGRICAQSVHACEHLFDRLADLARRMRKRCTIAVPIEPDTNLCCIAVNPTGNRSLAQMNRFGRALFARFSIDTPQVPGAREFVGSHTSLLRAILGAPAARRVARSCGFDPATFVAEIRDPELESDRLFVLRHTLMNPWLMQERDGRNYIDRYCEFLEQAIAQTLDAGA